VPATTAPPAPEPAPEVAAAPVPEPAPAAIPAPAVPPPRLVLVLDRLVALDEGR